MLSIFGLGWKLAGLISKIIYEKSKIEIKPSMIQPVKEIKSIGKFKVKIFLHSEVEAEIMIIVNSAETIQ